MGSSLDGTLFHCADTGFPLISQSTGIDRLNLLTPQKSLNIQENMNFNFISQYTHSSGLWQTNCGSNTKQRIILNPFQATTSSDQPGPTTSPMCAPKPHKLLCP